MPVAKIYSEVTDDSNKGLDIIVVLILVPQLSVVS